MAGWCTFTISLQGYVRFYKVQHKFYKKYFILYKTSDASDIYVSNDIKHIFYEIVRYIRFCTKKNAPSTFQLELHPVLQDAQYQITILCDQGFKGIAHFSCMHRWMFFNDRKLNHHTLLNRWLWIKKRNCQLKFVVGWVFCSLEQPNFLFSNSNQV